MKFTGSPIRRTDDGIVVEYVARGCTIGRPDKRDQIAGFDR